MLGYAEIRLARCPGLAAARAGRVSPPRYARLQTLTRRLADACELERTGQWIAEFLAAPPADIARGLVDRWFGERQSGAT